MLQDSFGRRMETLRISVTSACNFRCRYCMPPEGLPWLRRDQCLSIHDITEVARNFLLLGGKKLRITGGEPLLREELPELISLLTQLQGIDSLGLTTNGSLFAARARELWTAGLRNVNMSLDSLNPCRFEWICLSDQFEKVQQGLQEALRIGYRVKINTVVLKGMTRGDVESLVQLSVDHDIETRFIEFMPLCGTGWKPELCFPMQTVKDWISQRWNLEPIIRGSAPAESFKLSGGRGRVGFIASLTSPFCSDCSRIRLSADGKIYPCLFSKIGFDLNPYLKDVEQLQEQLRMAIWGKPQGHGAVSLHEWRGKEMPSIRHIGG